MKNKNTFQQSTKIDFYHFIIVRRKLLLGIKAMMVCVYISENKVEIKRSFKSNQGSSILYETNNHVYWKNLEFVGGR